MSWKFFNIIWNLTERRWDIESDRRNQIGMPAVFRWKRTNAQEHEL